MFIHNAEAAQMIRVLCGGAPWINVTAEKKKTPKFIAA
jgi:hypothetical protein